VRALAVANKTRTPLLPDVPTLAEAGVPDAEANTFFGLVAPAGTPASIIRRINSAMNEGLQTPEVQKVITNVGSEAKAGTSEDFAAYIAVQHRKWKEVGKAAGVIIN
jgi:tripartite-type tricarboxylate transporter receptor subunit TctC